MNNWIKTKRQNLFWELTSMEWTVGARWGWPCNLWRVRGVTWERWCVMGMGTDREVVTQPSWVCWCWRRN